MYDADCDGFFCDRIFFLQRIKILINLKENICINMLKFFVGVKRRIIFYVNGPLFWKKMNYIESGLWHR